MRMLHLADLHIGRRLNGLSLRDDQRAMLNEALSMAQACDAVLLAGDLFDKAQPGADSVKTVGDFLVALNRLQKPVLLISGNHDGAEQLAYCRELLSKSQVYASPVYDGDMRPVVLQDAYGPVFFWLLPFLKPAHARPFAPEVSSAQEAVTFALSRAQIDFSKRNVLLCHQFVTGGQSCQSEAVTVGGLDPVAAETFSAFDYVALGHLHSPQRLLGGKACYAGSPLKYSLSEEKQKKAALLITLEQKGTLLVESLPFHPLRELRTVRGPLAQVASEQSDDYLFAVLTDEEPLLDPIGTLRVSYPNLLGMKVENSRTGESDVLAQIESAEALSPMEHFIALYRAQHNDQPPAPRQMELLRQTILEAEENANEAHFA